MHRMQFQRKPHSRNILGPPRCVLLGSTISLACLERSMSCDVRWPPTPPFCDQPGLVSCCQLVAALGPDGGSAGLALLAAVQGSALAL